MADWFLFLCSLFMVSYSHQLAPFIIWSNSEVAQDIPITDDISPIVNSLATKIGSVNKVVIFTSDELSFDEFNKYAYVYDESSEDQSQFTQLKSAIETSVSHYWTGIQSSLSDDWMTKLAHGRNIRYMTSNDVHFSQSGQELVVIELSDFSTQDNVIASVMKEAQGMSFLAIYTHSSLVKHHLARRDVFEEPVIITKRDLPSLGATADQTGNSTACHMGGQFNASSDTDNVTIPDPCLLFCLDRMTYNFTLEGESSSVQCRLDTPYSIRACCSDQNYTMSDSCYGETMPFIQFNFTAGTTNISENVCNSSSNGTGYFDTADIVVRFLFPRNNSTVWSVVLESIVTVVTEMNGTVSQYFDNITRVNPSTKLYQPFEINEGLSYACSAMEYNRYVQKVGNLSNVTVILNRFQVQPYSVRTSTFYSAYNCEGYFTSTTWMGVISVAILLLILYVSMLCVFSVHTIDKFEDPRGQSISVEKLH